MRIAAAQMESKVGEIGGNLTKHLRMIALAGNHFVDLIAFPEMSLTGYCREEAKELVLKVSAPEILKLKEKSEEYNMTIIVGAPIEMDGELYIGAFILSPSKETEIYTKQFLHAGEGEVYASSFDYNPQISIGDETVSLAICADISNEAHALNAKTSHCSLYVSSLFYSENGIDEGHEILAKYSSKHSFSVLMSNYSGEVWGMKAGGKSAFWGKDGKLIAALDSGDEGLLMVEKIEDRWTQTVL